MLTHCILTVGVPSEMLLNACLLCCSLMFSKTHFKKKVLTGFLSPLTHPVKAVAGKVMLKLFKKALYGVLDDVRRMPTLIEL